MGSVGGSSRYQRTSRVAIPQSSRSVPVNGASLAAFYVFPVARKPVASASIGACPDARQHRTRDLGVLSLAVIAPIWGYGWVVSKVALDYAKPFTFIALIAASCAVCLFGLLLVTGRSLRPPPLGWTVAIGLLQTTVFNSLATLALSVGGAGKVSVLVYTMTFWLLLLAWLFLGERLRGLQWPAVALAFAGLVLVVRPWDIGGALSGVLAGAAGLAWAGGALLVKLLQRRTHVDPLSLTAWQMAAGAVPLIAVALATQSGWPDWSGTFIACLAYSALLSNALCWGLWVVHVSRGGWQIRLRRADASCREPRQGRLDQARSIT